MPGTIRSVLRGQRPVIRSDGGFVRDYFYVEDGAADYTFTVEKLAENRDLAGEAFNFSNEQPMSVLEIVALILRVMGSSLEPDVRNEAANEIRCQYLSAQKARSVLGWRPLFELEQGMSRTVDWYREHFAAAAL